MAQSLKPELAAATCAFASRIAAAGGGCLAQVRVRCIQAFCSRRCFCQEKPALWYTLPQKLRRRTLSVQRNNASATRQAT